MKVCTTDCGLNTLLIDRSCAGSLNLIVAFPSCRNLENILATLFLIWMRENMTHWAVIVA